ncbi:uncharacterized protein KZ484_023899 [Pholidichthys leucotaenia]
MEFEAKLSPNDPENMSEEPEDPRKHLAAPVWTEKDKYWLRELKTTQREGYHNNKTGTENIPEPESDSNFCLWSYLNTNDKRRELLIKTYEYKEETFQVPDPKKSGESEPSRNHLEKVEYSGIEDIRLKQEPKEFANGQIKPETKTLTEAELSRNLSTESEHSHQESKESTNSQINPERAMEMEHFSNWSKKSEHSIQELTETASSHIKSEMDTETLMEEELSRNLSTESEYFSQELKKSTSCQINPEMVMDEELSSNWSKKSGHSIQKLNETGEGQTKLETVTETETDIETEMDMETKMETKTTAGSRSFLGYFIGKLSQVYSEVSRRLQDTRDIIQIAGVDGMKVVLYQSMTPMPLVRQMPFHKHLESPIMAEAEVHMVDLSKNTVVTLPLNSGTKSVVHNISGWPEGSVSLLRDASPQVFHQRLVELPPALRELQTSSADRILENLAFLAPQTSSVKLQSVLWLTAANRKWTIPKPVCLVLSNQEITAVSAGSGSVKSLTIFHHFNLRDIKEVQIGLAGQHVRLIGCTEDTILTVFTYSKELTQEFCRALLKAICPEESTKDHPLLSKDLMVLSMDWTSIVPDLVLDCGLCLTSRFKRVLADLLYIVHGNMDHPGSPSLAYICPLLYTSVRIQNSTWVRQNTVSQFLLTDTHVALLWEDGVFHPVPRGSSLVPVQPQFQGLELCRRSEIRCLLVRVKDDCLLVDIIFRNQWGTRGDRPLKLGGSGQSWKLSFGCTTEARVLINHLCA